MRPQPIKIAVGLTVLAISALSAAGVSGQDLTAQPIAGTVSLKAGFVPDPSIIQVRAGGVTDATGVHANCRGYISNAADVRLNYSAGSMPLIISVDSAADTTLVVNGADGSWYCDDDSGVSGANPMVRFNTPGSGRYDIWIGTYSAGATQSARLHISEVASQ